jgi:hypothetical protein
MMSEDYEIKTSSGFDKARLYLECLFYRDFPLKPLP